MKNVLIIDTETTGLDPAKDRVIEIAAVRYSLEHAAVISTWSSLVHSEDNAAEAVNHIPAELAKTWGMAADEAWNLVALEVSFADAVLAHNADFDRQWVPAGCEPLQKLPWIDTCNGVVWPRESKPGSSLTSLALEHGLAVVDPHRALADCLLLARLLSRCAELGHDVVKLLERGLRPTAMFRALVSYDDRELAKLAGFQWEGSTKRWLRKMAIEDAQKLPFKTLQETA